MRMLSKTKKWIIVGVCAVVCIIAAIVLVVIIKSNTSVVITNEVTPQDDNTYVVTLKKDTSVDYSDIRNIKADAEQVVIAKVISIDGAINYSETLKTYTRIKTIGSIQILQVLKGDAKVNSTVPFIRLGGTISYNAYEKQVEADKGTRITGNTSQYAYVKEIAEGDIEIEEGKTYLMFLVYDEEEGRSEIIGHQYGLREYYSDVDKVRNNDTLIREKLSDLNLL